MMLRNLFEYDEYAGGGDYATFANNSGENFWGDQGAGVFVICEKTGRCLLGRRSDFVNEPNEWGAFGGMVDGGEDEMSETAERELVEETGYDGDVRMIPALVFTSEGGGFRYYNFVGLIDREYEPLLDWENDDFAWLNLSELERLEPKHFGLEALLADSDSMATIKKYMR